MKKLIELIKKLLGLSSSSSEEQKGFTLIELIIVIAILGILAAAVLAAIDPIDKLRAGNDSKVLGDVRQIYDASLRAYATANMMPTALTGTLTAPAFSVVQSGELKTSPVPPAAYGAAYNWFSNSGTQINATDVCVGGRLMSKGSIAKARAQSPSVTATAQNLYIVATNGKTCYRVGAPTAALCTAAASICP